MRWDKAIGDAGFAILPAFFSHEYLDQLLQEIDESAPVEAAPAFGML